eukprot:1071747-Amphidinium_carterae.1
MGRGEEREIVLAVRPAVRLLRVLTAVPRVCIVVGLDSYGLNLLATSNCGVDRHGRIGEDERRSDVADLGLG